MHLNAYALAALASAGIPGIDPVATAVIATQDEGIDAARVVDSQDRTWVVTAPSTPSAGARVAKEVEVLEALSGTELAPYVQSPQGFAQMPEGGRAVIALALEGSPLHPQRAANNAGLASDLGRVLALIHNTARWASDEAGVEEFSTSQLRERHRANILRAHAEHPIPAAVAQRWKLMLMNDELWDFTPRFIHGALHEERMMAVDDAVTGILGWDNAAVADPATDIAWVLSALDADDFDVFYTAYTAHVDIRPDRHLLERSQLAGEFAVLEWLLAGMDTANDDIVTDALSMLEDVAEDLAQLAREQAEQDFEDLRD